MGKTPLNLTKRSRVLGLPVGRRRTDWRKVAMLGVGAASSIAGGIGAKRKGSQGLAKGKEMLGNVTSVSEQAGSIGKAMSGASSPIGKVTAAVKSTASDGADGGGKNGGRNVKKLRMIIRETIEVAVPKTVAYNQWTQFAELPSIVKGVEAVDQEDDDVVEWTAKIGPSRRTWKAEITEQVPDEKIAWESKSGPENRGVITFHELDNNLTLVAVEMEYFPTGVVEKVGNVFLAARRRVRKDLRLFKHYIELAGEETGAWRGEISKDDDGDESREEEPRGSGGQAGDEATSKQDDEPKGEQEERKEDSEQGSDIDLRDKDREQAAS